MALPPLGAARPLAARLRRLGYSVDGVRSLLGEPVAAAYDSGDVVPARRLLAGADDLLATAVRLFLLADAVPTAAVGAVVDGIACGDLFVDDGRQTRSALEVAPYAADDVDWLIASDWSPGVTRRPAGVEHVLGVGGASRMLAQCTVRPSIRRALDVGTGCGIQAFHLTRHATQVVATDVSERCLALAAWNAELNDLALDLRAGNLLEPVAGERFDLVVSNPPFVIASPDDERHDYRDSGLPGDEVCARLVRQAPDVLADGGWMQLLANWEIHAGESWDARPRQWLADSGLDAWVLQRDVQDPSAYVTTWLRDSGSDAAVDYPQRYDAWLSALADRGVVGVGFGLVTVRSGGRALPVRRFQHAPQPLVQPVGPDVSAWFARQDLLAGHPGADVLALPLRPADDVLVDVVWRPGTEVPEAVGVRRTTGMAWTGDLDPFGHAVLDALDGRLAVGEVVAGLAAAEGLDVADALSASVPVVRHLLEEGFLEPVAELSAAAGTVDGV